MVLDLLNSRFMNCRLLLLLSGCLGSLLLGAQSFRYVETVFPAATVTANVRYAEADFLNFPYFNESSTTRNDLFMDVYLPSGDANTNRPAIIFAHSGGFINGNRNHDDIVALCDSFARKGYVTATIDYRLGFNLLSDVDLHGTRAVYRGLQDGRSAVRFLRANAAAYGIDPTKVYFAGSSAGSFIALHSIYMEDPAEKPFFANPVNYSNLVFPFNYTGPNLGGYDIGDHLSQRGTPDAIMALWGAVQTTDLITPGNAQPVFLVHGSNDGTVPFGLGNPFGFAAIPAVEGSQLINAKLTSIGLSDHETYFVDGVGHEFHGTSNGTWDNGSGGNAYWDTIINRAEQFFWKRHKPTADFSVSANNLTAEFTFAGTGAISWQWDFGDGAASTEQNPLHIYSGSGIYSVYLYVENNNLSWDTIRREVQVQQSLPVTWAQPLRAERLEIGNRLSWSVVNQLNCESFTVEHARNEGEFHPLQTLVGDGNRAEERAFSLLHEKAGTGNHYYRIRQRDYDGSTSFSNTTVVIVQSSRIEVYPNPSSGVLTVALPPGDGGTIGIFNTTGRQIRQFELSSRTGQLDLRELPPGIYLIKTLGGGEAATRFVIH